MFTANLIVTLLASGANIYAVINDFTQPDWLLASMTKLGVPSWSLFWLGALKAAGAIGLLVGITVPPIGVAAAVGLVLFFIGAVVTAIRAHWYGQLPIRLRGLPWPVGRWHYG
jgi:DoxX-like family